LIELLQPPRLFNPLLAPRSAPLSPAEIAAGPFGLMLFIFLVPLVRVAARRRPRTALIGFGLLWLVWTLGPIATGIFLAAVATGALWILALGRLRQTGRLGRGPTIALVWIGLHALVLPAWWIPSAAWYGWEPTRMPLLHNIGFAYFLLRFIAWGRQLVEGPFQPSRLSDTICWILYPPCMRLGPVLTREKFLERFDAWTPAGRPDWRAVGRRCGLFLLGGLGLGVTISNMPAVRAGAADFFSQPQQYGTDQLLSAVYLIPIQIYFLLWTYNQLANGLAAWVGIPVDDNFDRLPLATSVREFWRRWHITVGDWLRDNIYIPLGGNRGIVWLNYVAVFGYIGLWHGPSWSFLAWGLLQAAALIVQRGWDQYWKRRDHRGRPAGLPWTVFCWLLTIHFAIVTIVMFTDFDHLGTRIFPELLRRFW
jgi:D-alanyl-lipoteichoic acid acyltransferase DltB (MBOAT superfamily)